RAPRPTRPCCSSSSAPGKCRCSRQRNSLANENLRAVMARECGPPSSHRFGELPKLPGHGVLGRPDSGVPIAQARWGCPGRAMTRGGRLDLPSTTFSYVTLTKDSPPANGGTRWASIGGLAAEHREDGAVARAAAAD